MFKPLHDFIIIKPIKAKVTQGGIIVDGMATASGNRTAEVIEVGCGSEKYPAPKYVTVGQRVAYEGGKVCPIVFEGEDYLLTRECDLLGIYDDN